MHVLRDVHAAAKEISPVSARRNRGFFAARGRAIPDTARVFGRWRCNGVVYQTFAHHFGSDTPPFTERRQGVELLFAQQCQKQIGGRAQRVARCRPEMAYIGCESGDDEVLRLVNKSETFASSLACLVKVGRCRHQAFGDDTQWFGW